MLCRAVGGLVVLALLLSGCGRTHRAASPLRVAPNEWKRLVNDAYDGRIDHAYPCVVARQAVAHLPGDCVACTVPLLVERYEHRVC